MEYALLGRTGVKVSRICFGTALFGIAPLTEDVQTLVDRALELGINFIDTANSYGNRASFDRPGAPPHYEREPAETLLGKALARRRHDVILASKCGERVYEGPNGRGLSRVHVKRAAEESLQRLQTDYIDLYYAHHPDPETPIEETLLALESLVREGKVRYFALSNFAGWQVTEAALRAGTVAPTAAPVCNQVRYSLAARQVEREVLSACEQFGLSVLPYSPLAGGLLTGVANTRLPIAGTRRWRGGDGPGYTEAEIGMAERMDAISAAWGHSAGQLALAWLLAKPNIASVVIGPGRLASLEDNAAAADIELSDEQLAELDAVGA